MDWQARNVLLVVGIAGVVIFGGLFVFAHDQRPFDLVPPLVESVLLALVMGPLLLLSVALQDRFDVASYLGDREPAGVALDVGRVIAVAALFGIAAGFLLGFLTDTHIVRIGIIALVEYFSAFWVFSLANARYYDDRHIRRALGR